MAGASTGASAPSIEATPCSNTGAFMVRPISHASHILPGTSSLFSQQWPRTPPGPSTTRCCSRVVREIHRPHLRRRREPDPCYRREPDPCYSSEQRRCRGGGQLPGSPRGRTKSSTVFLHSSRAGLDAGTSTASALSATASPPPPFSTVALEAAPEQETYDQLSVTASEVALTLCRREESKSWTNRVLTSAQQGSLKLVREQADAMHQGVTDMMDVFAADMEVCVHHAFKFTHDSIDRR